MRFFIICSLVLLSFSCSSTEKIQSLKKPEKVLRLNLQDEPMSLDPRGSDRRASRVVVKMLFEGLTRLTADSKPQLAMARSMSVSPDGLTYTFELHPALWSNGERVSAHDFEYGWKGMLAPDFDSQFANGLYVLKNAEEAKRGTG